MMIGPASSSPLLAVDSTARMFVFRAESFTRPPQRSPGQPCGCQTSLSGRPAEVFYVHEFELGVATLLRDFLSPLGDGLAVATRPRASEDDGNSKHKFLPCCFPAPCGKLSMFYTQRREVKPEGAKKNCVMTAPPVTTIAAD